jgi:hypothetical protein
MDMEITTDNPIAKAYDQAWVKAEELGLTRKLHSKPDTLNVLMAWKKLLSNNQ